MPLLPVNIQNDYKIFDGTESITFFRRLATQPKTFDAGTTVAAALRRASARQEVQTAGGQLVKVELVWHLPQVQVGNPQPKVNDVIQDGGGVRWSVLSVDADDFDTRFRCLTIQERTSGG